MENSTETAAILELHSAAQRRIVEFDVENVPLLAVPNAAGSYSVVSCENFQPRPHRLTGTVQIQDSESFIAYVRAFAGERSLAIFADSREHRWTAVFDYHTHAAAGWGAHRAVLNMEQDTRFKRWLANNEKFMPQTEFAEFLEDMMPFIMTPSSSELLDVIADLRVDKKINIQSTKTLRNGNASLTWDEQTTESREVPLMFTLRIPVFRSSRTAYEVRARLRYRFTPERQLKWLYVIDQLEDCLNQAWQLECAALGALREMEIPVFIAAAPEPVKPLIETFHGR